jgi:hypothetical protein
MPEIKHGKRKSKEYTAWDHMKRRCMNSSHPKYKNYGGRGITVCEAWLDFINFYRDMGDCPSPKHSLDRINNNGNYEPENCRWATFQQQQNNRRDNIIISFAGRTMTISEWSRFLKIPKSTLHRRIKLGWSYVRTLTEDQRIKRQTDAK